MKIRIKVAALLAVVCLVLTLGEWAIGRGLLLPRFEEIELDSARTAMKRIDYSLHQRLAGLQVSATDWANWADTYRYMQDGNQDFGRENLTPTAMKQLHLSALAFIDRQGNIVWSRSVDAASGAPLRLDLLAGTALPAQLPWRRQLLEGRPAQGLIATNQGVLMAAVSPVLDGFGHGPSRGMVLMGRMLTPTEVADIGARAQTEVAIDAIHAAADADPRVAPGGDLLTTPETLSVFHTLPDVYGRPLVTLRVDTPRTITTRARATVAYAMEFTVGAAIALLVLMLVALDRAVLSPLARVTRHAVELGKGDDLTTRLDLHRADEIGTLATEFDRMVARVADSRRQLIDHSFHAGMAELSRGVLHNIGNAMTPLAVRVAKLQERLRAAPTGDVTLALAELGSAEHDDGRRADLVEFLRLAADEMARVITAAQDDADVMARQAALVQNALSEQLRSSRGPTVLENVDIPSVVHQSLDIVPDNARERLAIELDPSVHAIGPVRVARTVLRLVFQNLIINAAEAIRAAGHEHGSLRIAATMTIAGSERQLQISCTDSGTGIAAENLTRVFERGYSTKVGTGNLGIGLHWCATALAALGGRIWATSDGVGRGTTMHIVLPIPSATASAAAA